MDHNKILKAINEGINKALMLFDDGEPNFKKSSNVGEIAKEHLWIENNTVDLGLPSGTRWATCNIGAEKPTDRGLYFLWGDPVGRIDAGKKYYYESDYKWYDVFNEYTKYTTDNGDTTLDLDDDGAYIHSNGKFISPTVEQCNELKIYCDWSWTTINGVNGYKVQSKVNDEYIFLPAAGYCFNKNISQYGYFGYYWTRNLYFDKSAYTINIDPTNTFIVGFSRNFGCSIRGVLL